MAQERFGIVARTNREAAAAISDQTNTISRSTTLAACPAVAIPSPIPTPNAVTTSPHPDGPASSVDVTNTGPIASTAPTAPKATTMPPVIADAIEFSRRKLIPSFVSRQTRDSVRRWVVWLGCGRIAIPATMLAENRNVPASNRRASDSGWVASAGIRPPIQIETAVRTANAAPPIGSVA